MPRFTLRLNASGCGQVLLDGQPLETVAVAVTSEAGEPTEVTVVFPAYELDVEVDVDREHLHLARKQL